MKTACLLASLVTLLVPYAHAAAPAEPSPRTWTDISGRFTVVATPTAISDTSVTLKPAGRDAITVPLSRLSDNDIHALREMARHKQLPFQAYFQLTKLIIERNSTNHRGLGELRKWTFTEFPPLTASLTRVTAEQVELTTPRGAPKHYDFDDLSDEDQEFITRRRGDIAKLRKEKYDRDNPFRALAEYGELAVPQFESVAEELTPHAWFMLAVQLDEKDDNEFSFLQFCWQQAVSSHPSRKKVTEEFAAKTITPEKAVSAYADYFVFLGGYLQSCADNPLSTGLDEDILKRAQMMKVLPITSAFATLAAVHARNGQFEDASKYTELALDSSQNRKEQDLLKERLSHYSKREMPPREHTSREFVDSSGNYKTNAYLLQVRAKGAESYVVMQDVPSKAVLAIPLSQLCDSDQRYVHSLLRVPNVDKLVELKEHIFGRLRYDLKIAQGETLDETDTKYAPLVPKIGAYVWKPFGMRGLQPYQWTGKIVGKAPNGLWIVDVTWVNGPFPRGKHEMSEDEFTVRRAPSIGDQLNKALGK